MKCKPTGGDRGFPPIYCGRRFLTAPAVSHLSTAASKSRVSTRSAAQRRVPDIPRGEGGGHRLSQASKEEWKKGNLKLVDHMLTVYLCRRTQATESDANAATTDGGMSIKFDPSKRKVPVPIQARQFDFSDR